MAEWEYLKIDLNQHPPRVDELDLLNQAGADRWELVNITATNIAYLKRLVEESNSAGMRNRLHARSPDGNGNLGHEVAIKYRDQATGDTWTGRGRMATWLKRKQEAGEDIRKYLMEPE